MGDRTRRWPAVLAVFLSGVLGLIANALLIALYVSFLPPPAVWRC